jgi:formylglycine-generating enzyme required for sulfatase activity
MSDSSIPPVDAGALANMVFLDGGTFGFPVTEISGGVMDATATITYTIAIDSEEVTIGRFAAWIDAGLPLPADQQSLDPGGPYQGVMKWDDTNWHAHAVSTGYLGGSNCYGAGGNAPQPTYPALASQPGYPLNCVTWEQALAFCWWDHQKRLPTETEWHVAATSRGQPNQYPWGNTNPPNGDAGCLYSVSQCNGTSCLFPVAAGFATAGVTPLGFSDLVGSVSEWNWDLVGTNYSYPTTPTVNYYGPDSGNAMGSRMFIESSWYNCAPTVDPSAYGGGGTTDPYDDCGFRCAKTLP